jgi:hypothetical protein
MYYCALTEDLIEPEVDFSVMNKPAYAQLSDRPSDLQIIPESALVGVGMSRIWDSAKTRPVWTQGGKGTLVIFLS